MRINKFVAPFGAPASGWQKKLTGGRRSKDVTEIYLYALMADKELIEKAMEMKGWTKQTQVARFLRVADSKISRVLKGSEDLHPSSRKLLELLIEEKLEDHT